MNGSWSKAVTLAPLLGFLLTLLVMPGAIAWLRRINFGQNVRDDGPESHQAKAGTPTMGGIAFLPLALIIGVAADWLLSPSVGRRSLIIALFAAAGMLIGWLDDYRGIKRGRSLGLKAREKLILQFVISAGFIWAIRELGPLYTDTDGSPLLLWDAPLWQLGLLAVASVWIINAANIADGLDGLAASQAIVALASIAAGSYLTMSSMGFSYLWAVAAACLLAYLCFNCPPAKVFMGDTGAIGLGCLIAATGLVYVPLWVLAAATAVWSLESMSVVIQVVYFKLTGGKRIFKMAPLHHHFELCGWAETTVTARFVIASIVFGILLPVAYVGIFGK